MVKVVGYVFLDAIETSDEGYIVAGSTYVNSGRSDAIIIKYNEKGNIEWQQNYSGSASEDFEAITTSPDGGYVVVGDSSSTDIEGIENKGSDDAIIVKYDEEGNIERQESYAYADNTTFVDIIYDGKDFVVSRT